IGRALLLMTGDPGTLLSAIHRSEERERAYLDAFARPWIRRCRWVVECRVRSPAGAPVLERIIDLEDQRLVAPHPREPVPAVLRIVFYGVGLPHAIGVPALGHDQVVIRQRAGVADCKREALYRKPDRAPDLHDGKSAAQECVGFLRQQVAHAL